jgi:HEPN domain-containing protein
VSRVRTGGRPDALAHLGKAQECLQAARAALEAGWHNAAASSAVTAGINAKDALCFALAGRSTAGDDHRSAVNELRTLGSAGREPAIALDRLLGLKDRAQYDRRGVTATEAQAGVRRAATLVEAAERELSP